MIQFKGEPLFGKECSPQRNSSFFSLVGTFIFWLILLITAACIKGPEKKPKYKEVQIVLSPLPTQQKNAESPAPAAPASAPVEAEKAPAPKTETVQAPAPKKAVEKPAPKKEPPKPAPKTSTKTVAKQTPSPVPAAEPVLYEDPMEAFNKQTQKKSKDSFDWGIFEDTDEMVDTSSQDNYVAPTPVQSSFEGVAGSTSQTNTNTKQTSTSRNSSSDTNASAKTASTLGRIADTTFTGNAVAGIQSESSVKAKATGTGKVMMEMADGSSRALINPAEPVINLSEKAASSIDGSKTVTISFKVTESGNVPFSDISITPASALPEIVKNEIYKQISNWLFESESFTSTAKFEYRIVRK